ncbi:MAG: hypothetical protein ACOYNI_07570 [Acidimicrobiia bacterium]
MAIDGRLAPVWLRAFERVDRVVPRSSLSHPLWISGVAALQIEAGNLDAATHVPMAVFRYDRGVNDLKVLARQVQPLRVAVFDRVTSPEERNPNPGAAARHELGAFVLNEARRLPIVVEGERGSAPVLDPARVVLLELLSAHRRSAVGKESHSAIQTIGMAWRLHGDALARGLKDSATRLNWLDKAHGEPIVHDIRAVVSEATESLLTQVRGTSSITRNWLETTSRTLLDLPTPGVERG